MADPETPTDIPTDTPTDISASPEATPAADGITIPPADGEEQRPDHIPEKFWRGNLVESSKAMAKSYAELEAARHTANPDPKPDANPLAVTPGTDVAQSVVDRAGLKMDDLVSQYDTNGSLTDEQFQALEKQGLSRVDVESYISGEVAKGELKKIEAERITASAAELVGSKEQLDTLLAWAGKNLSLEEREDVNAQLASRHGWKNAIEGLKSRFERAAGSTGDPLIDTSGIVQGGSSGGGFQSQAEVTAAVGDIRYQEVLSNGRKNVKHDPEYARAVRQRLANTADVRTLPER